MASDINRLEMLVFALGIVDEAEQNRAIKELASRIAPLLCPKTIDAFFDRCRDKCLRELAERRLRSTAMA
jgi:hypothetical protein